jgi:hypothetical protein
MAAEKWEWKDQWREKHMMPSGERAKHFFLRRRAGAIRYPLSVRISLLGQGLRNVKA